MMDAKSSRARWHFAALSLSLLAGMSSAYAGGVTAEDTKQIRALVLEKAAAESARDIDAIDASLAHSAPGQPDPVSYVARAYRFWGRDAVIEHFRKVFAGTWRVEPDQDAIRITPLNADTAQIYVPTRVTIGAAGQSATTSTFLINEIAIRTEAGWKITAVIPVPAE
jgi:SnoaL-like domain